VEGAGRLDCSGVSTAQRGSYLQTRLVNKVTDSLDQSALNAEDGGEGWLWVAPSPLPTTGVLGK